jgi:catechol 2,3-dioxygenase-like lactoylglutathione lyase family enzyme
MSAPLAGKKLAQVAFVVRDIEAAKSRWAAALGFEERLPMRGANWRFSTWAGSSWN